MYANNWISLQDPPSTEKTKKKKAGRQTPENRVRNIFPINCQIVARFLRPWSTETFSPQPFTWKILLTNTKDPWLSNRKKNISWGEKNGGRRTVGFSGRKKIKKFSLDLSGHVQQFIRLIPRNGESKLNLIWHFHKATRSSNAIYRGICSFSN